MVLKVAYTLATYVLPTTYYWHVAITIGALVVIYAFAQGRTTDRERDLHARTVLITGAFTPVGLTLAANLAKRGAHIIALSPYPLSHPLPALLIPALRESSKNEKIFAEHADLSSPASIREFCTRFLTGDDQRLDAIVFGHEYAGVGSLFASKAIHDERREASSLATFLMVTLLLPTLLVAPVERDIRIINLVNPFYAAAVPSFSSDLVASFKTDFSAPAKQPLLQREGHRALRTIIFTRHLQRILNALPNRAPTFDANMPGGIPEPAKPSNSKEEAPTPPKYPSNIVALSVAPGMSRTETVRAALGADKEIDFYGWSRRGLAAYILLFPIIWLLAKTPSMAIQSILHALFLPAPFKQALAQVDAATAGEAPPKTDGSEPNATSAQPKQQRAVFTEVIKPGALYRECSVVTVKLPPLPEDPTAGAATEKPNDDTSKEAGKAKDKKGKGKAKASPAEGTPKDEFVPIEDDGEYGGESMGRVVWEWFEIRLKDWEAREKAEEEPASPSKAAKDQKEKAE